MSGTETEKTYVTLERYGTAELIERKSRFIGHAAPVKTEKQALDFIEQIKGDNTQANHNVYAYLLRDNNIQRYSDANEPKGTAGIPVLDIIRKNNFTDAVIVVTRYFGGILLGAGGLVRAYSSAAKAAVDDAHIVTYKSYCEFTVKVNYSDYQKLQNDFEKYGIKTDDTAFSDDVTLKLAIKETEFPLYREHINELLSARASISVTGSRFDFE